MRIRAKTRAKYPRSSLFFISVGIVFLPVPRIPAHILERFLGLPTKHIQSLVRIGVKLCEISGSAVAVNMVDLDVVHTLKGLDDLGHAVRNASPEVEYLAALVLSENIVDSFNVSLCEINNVNVVALTGAVLCWIVLAKNCKALALSDCNLRNIRH